MMKKINIFLTVLFLSILTIHAQQKNAVEALNDASYVFKGTIVSEKPFKGENFEDFFIDYVINIETIYKGSNLSLGEVHFINESPVGWTEMENGLIVYDVVISDYASLEDKLNAPAPLKLGVGLTAIFLCNKNTNPVPSVLSKTINYFALEPICNQSYCLIKYESVSRYNRETKGTDRTDYVRGFDQEFSISDVDNNKTRTTVWNSSKSLLWDQMYTFMRENGFTPKKQQPVKKK